jgi:flagellar biosynthesis/type III secretory pathway protein FliH
MSETADPWAVAATEPSPAEAAALVMAHAHGHAENARAAAEMAAQAHAATRGLHEESGKQAVELVQAMTDAVSRCEAAAQSCQALADHVAQMLAEIRHQAGDIQTARAQP